MRARRIPVGRRVIMAALAAMCLDLVTPRAQTAAASGLTSPLPVTSHLSAVIRRGLVPSYDVVSFLGQQTGHVAGTVGNEGVVWSTTTGGATWTRSAVGPVQATALDFTSARVGWILGSPTNVHCPANGCPNVLYRTTSGGKRWQAALPLGAASRASLDLTAVDFLTAHLGYGLGDQGRCGRWIDCNTTLYRTLDGGQHWTAVPMHGFAPSSLQFLTTSLGFVGGFQCGAKVCHAAVLSTTDSGQSWAMRELPVPPYPESAASVHVDFVDPQHGWVLATPPEGTSMGGEFGPLFATRNGGRTWHVEQSTFTWGLQPDTGLYEPGFPLTITFASRTTGWIPVSAGASGGAGGVDVTTDSGRTWTRLGAYALWSMTSLTAAGPDRAWAVGSPKMGGPSFVVELSPNGSLRRQVLPALAPDAGIALTGPTTSLGIGLPSSPGAVLASQGGRSTWRQESVLSHVSVPQAIGVPAGRRGRKLGWVIAQMWPSKPVPSTQWAIWRTWDSGRTWDRVHQAASDLLGVSFFPHGQGIAIQSASFGGPNAAYVVTTHNGGVTWTRRAAAPVEGELMAAAFPSARTGYAATLQTGGQAFTVWTTTDGGLRWHILGTLPFGNGSPALLDFPTPRVGWLAVGSTLYRTHDSGQTWTKIFLGETVPTAISFLGSNRGAMVLPSGSVLRTSNGGQTWTRAS